MPVQMNGPAFFYFAGKIGESAFSFTINVNRILKKFRQAWIKDLVIGSESRVFHIKLAQAFGNLIGAAIKILNMLMPGFNDRLHFRAARCFVQ